MSIFLDDAIAAYRFYSAAHFCGLFRRRKGTDKSPIVDPRGTEVGATNDRLVAAELVRVFRLQSPKSGLSPAFTALRCHLNRIATSYDGSGHCRSVRIGMCDRDGSKMPVVRRSRGVCPSRLVEALRGSGNCSWRRGSTGSHGYARHRLVRYRLIGGGRHRRARPGQRTAPSRFRGRNRGWLLFTRHHVIDRAGGRRTDLSCIAAAYCLRLVRRGRDPVLCVDGLEGRRKRRENA